MSVQRLTIAMHGLRRRALTKRISAAMRRSSVAVGLALVLCVAGAPAALAASVNVVIDLSDQRVYVSAAGRHYAWATSTARRGYRTPVGTYRPIRLERTWYSRKYNMSPMPYSIFFHGGYAIHGTTEIRNLGRPASHGCVRLHPANARVLFDLVRRFGKSATRITVRP